MIIPSGTKMRSSSNPVLEAALEEVLTAMPRWVLPVVPREDVCRINWELREPSSAARRMAELIGDQVVGEAIDAVTDHAWLIVLGYFAQALGLVAGLASVPLEQRKTAAGEPQSKLIEFLVGVLGGVEYLQELNQSDSAIVRDETVAEAWAQKVFVHYSNVSRALKAADENTLTAVIDLLQTLSRPFIEAAVMETLRQYGRLVVDVDLTGREVSPNSSDYPEAGFGWMDGEVRKGYQAAVTSLVCERWQRLMLTLQRYPGCTGSAECLQAAVQAIEASLGVRPRRRVELLQEGRHQLLARIHEMETKLAAWRHKETTFWRRIQESQAEILTLQDTIVELEAVYRAQERPERPHSYLAKAQRKQIAAQKREQRAWRELKKLQSRRDRHQVKLKRLQDNLISLDERWDELEIDNQTNLNPVSIVLRIDAGFSTGLNLAWLIEMGYIVLTKACHASIAQSLRQRLTAQPPWTRVGRNAEAVYMGDYNQNDCPYPLQAMLVRYHLPDKLLHTALLYYGATPPPALADWFAAYNSRQITEAGIKESKGVFTLKRHLVRSPIGMQLQEQFALFAANFVRWAAAWVKDMLQQANHHFTTALQQVKTLVRTVSRARARWVRNALGHALIFDERGPFAGTVICLSGQMAIQLTLPLFNFAPL